MNLEDLVDENGLQQDEWSLGEPRFGKGGQLTVIGWSGKQGSNKFYILKCKTCSRDMQLFGEGYFRSLRANLVRGKIPCGCASSPRWTENQYSTLCSRKAEDAGYEFLGFVGEWKGAYTKINMFCTKHGDWRTLNVNHLLNTGAGCPSCKAETIKEIKTKPNNIMVNSFLSTGAFHPDTKFWRSDRVDSQGGLKYWYVHCPECGQLSESMSGHLQKGQRSCGCSRHRQQECYINYVLDHNNTPIAIKFGIANNSRQRIKNQNRLSIYTIYQHSIYAFPDVISCKKAEQQCLQELECGILSKEEMSDGWTETTWVYNLEKIIEIYERNGAIKEK